MKNIILALLMGALPQLGFAANAGFKSGDHFVAHPIRGQLHVSCYNVGPGQPTSAFASCGGEYLDPNDTDYFLGPKADADKVSLQATFANGKKSHVKKSSYDGVQAVSKSRFNLWIATLTQSPLLDYGINRVSYEISKDSNVVDRGEFQVQVDTAPLESCEFRELSSYGDASACTNPNTLCNRYFAEQNYCQK